MEQDGIFKSPARQSLSLRACGLTEAGPNLDSSLVGSQVVFKLDVGWERGVVTEQLKCKPQVCSVRCPIQGGESVPRETNLTRARFYRTIP
jgi:hypothetical protein